MVKLNLLQEYDTNVVTTLNKDSLTNAKEIQPQEIEDNQELSPQIEFEQPIEFQEEPTSNETIEPVPDSNPTIPTETSFKSEHDMDTNFEQSFNSKKVFIIIGIILGVILIGFIIYRFIGSMGEGVTPTMTETEQKEAPPGIVQSNNQLNNLFSQNQKDNLASSNATQKLFNLISPNLNYSIIIISPSLIQFSVLANSNNNIDLYRSSLKTDFPTSQIRLVNKKSITIVNSDKILADFSLDLSGVNVDAPLNETREIDSKTISDTWHSAAQNHNLTITYFKKGKQVTNNQVEQILFYSTLAGSTGNLINFINEVINFYPAINFAKISLNPSNQIITQKGKTTARITLLLNQSIAS